MCNNPSIDIVVLAFLNVFPDQGLNGYPGTNFGSACKSTTFTTVDGLPTQLLNDCPEIEPGINACQSVGKKVLLSLGGAAPGNYYLASPTSAQNFANFHWGAFGPNQNNGYPRPFGNAAVNGFDLDLEPSGVTEAQGQQYYPDLISQLRINYDNYGGVWYISGAPQCITPDAHLSNSISSSWFDFLFVQPYNTDACSARSYVNTTYNGTYTFNDWLSQGYINDGILIYAGLVSSTVANTRG